MIKQSRDMAYQSTSESVPQMKSTKKFTPYDPNYLQNLVDHSVYPDGHEFSDDRAPPEPENLQEIQQRMLRHRASLSPSRSPETKFKEFRQVHKNAKKEAQVISYVIPLIEGKVTAGNYRCGQIRLANLAHLTDGNLAPANPDLFYGSLPDKLNRAVRGELSSQIIPSTQDNLPTLPNFFLAAKGPDGTERVAEMQAVYDGALGARGMHSLQSYGQDRPTYDNKAYTISSTYCSGTLQLYTTHPRAPRAPGGHPEYHMTPLQGFSMSGSADDFRRGTAAFRNLRDWAREQREEAIRGANETFAARTMNVQPVGVPTASTASTLATEALRDSERVAQESQSSMYEDVEAAALLQPSDTSADELAVVHEAPAKKQRARRPARPSKHLQLKKRSA